MPRERCANTEALNAYMRKIDDGERRQEAIDEEVERLTEQGGEFYPFSTDHVAEAMSELGANDLDRIAQFCDQTNVAMAGGALYYAIKNYWLHLAKSKAEEQVEGYWNSCVCHGRGCRLCDEDERIH